jgi:hypothetical protein
MDPHPRSAQDRELPLKRTRLSVCNRKARFASEPDALLAVQASGLVLRPYRCDRCRHFHLTSRTKGKRIPGPA